MRYIIILILFVNSIFAFTINDSLLKIHALLVPKILLMDYKYKEKCPHNKIIINLVHEEINYKSALSLKEQIDKKYKNGINNYEITTKLVTYKRLNRQNANVYYLFPSSVKNIKKAIKIAYKNSAITFSYLKNDLKYGVMVSLNIGTYVKPILNLHAIREGKITFRPVLLNISTIYLKDEESILKGINGFFNHKTKIATLNLLYKAL